MEWNSLFVCFFSKEKTLVWWSGEVAYFVDWIETDGLQIFEAMFVNFLMYA